jgi:hypothetical protein
MPAWGAVAFGVVLSGVVAAVGVGMLGSLTAT